MPDFYPKFEFLGSVMGGLSSKIWLYPVILTKIKLYPFIRKNRCGSNLKHAKQNSKQNIFHLNYTPLLIPSWSIHCTRLVNLMKRVITLKQECMNTENNTEIMVSLSNNTKSGFLQNNRFILHLILKPQNAKQFFVIGWQRFCELARLRIAYCPCVSCPPPHSQGMCLW